MPEASNFTKIHDSVLHLEMQGIFTSKKKL